MSSEFHVCALSVNPCEFGIVEKVRATGPDAASSIELFRRCAGRVYRSDYRILLQYRRLMRAFQRIAAALDPALRRPVRYHDTELPLDEFLPPAGRSGRARERRRPWRTSGSRGSAIMSFDGRLEAIDYRGAAWTGRLTLAGGETQIECVFDKSMGEDALNPFGNKDVSRHRAGDFHRRQPAAGADRGHDNRGTAAGERGDRHPGVACAWRRSEMGRWA